MVPMSSYGSVDNSAIVNSAPVFNTVLTTQSPQTRVSKWNPSSLYACEHPHPGLSVPTKQRVNKQIIWNHCLTGPFESHIFWKTSNENCPAGNHKLDQALEHIYCGKVQVWLNSFVCNHEHCTIRNRLCFTEEELQAWREVLEALKESTRSSSKVMQRVYTEWDGPRWRTDRCNGVLTFGPPYRDKLLARESIDRAIQNTLAVLAERGAQPSDLFVLSLLGEKKGKR